MLLAEFGQESDAGEACAQFVVDILGDARALFFQRMLLLKQAQVVTDAPNRPGPHAPATTTQHGDSGERGEPPGLPKRWKHPQLEGSSDSIPDSIAITGRDLKAIISRRQAMVRDRALLAVLNPIPFETLQAVPE